MGWTRTFVGWEIGVCMLILTKAVLHFSGVQLFAPPMTCYALEVSIWMVAQCQMSVCILIPIVLIAALHFVQLVATCLMRCRAQEVSMKMGAQCRSSADQ